MTTIIKSSTNGIEVRSKCIGKGGGSTMNDTKADILSKSNIESGKVMTIIKSSTNGIEVRSKGIGKGGGTTMNDTKADIILKSNIKSGKVNWNNLCYV